MEHAGINYPPGRITDLMILKQKGSIVTCKTSFEVLPVDFSHRSNPFQAYIFLCRYTGEIDKQQYSFKKCYARGCPNNLCTHVSQAVMIANRYLQRDYHKLEQVGIKVIKRLFTLEEMTVKFDGYQEEHGPLLAIHDYINIAGEGSPVAIAPALEFVPAVEHFANHKHQMVFLMVNFTVTCLGETHHYERCLACYPMEKETEERQQKIEIANARLKSLYTEFDAVEIKYDKQFFS